MNYIRDDEDTWCTRKVLFCVWSTNNWILLTMEKLSLTSQSRHNCSIWHQSERHRIYCLKGSENLGCLVTILTGSKYDANLLISNLPKILSEFYLFQSQFPSKEPWNWGSAKHDSDESPYMVNCASLSLHQTFELENWSSKNLTIVLNLWSNPSQPMFYGGNSNFPTLIELHSISSSRLPAEEDKFVAWCRLHWKHITE